MPQPTAGELHVDTPLTNIAVAYREQGNFLADAVFPIVPTDKQSNKYFTFGAEVFRTARGEYRAPGAPPAKTGYSVSTDTYFCDRISLSHDIPDPVRANADAPLNMDQNGTDFVLSSLMLDLEVLWAATYFTTSVWTGSSTGSDISVSTAWSDVTSTPIEDVQTQQRAMEANTGFMPNRLVLGRKVYDNLIRHPDILDLIKYGAGPGNPAVANAQSLAAVFGVEQVLVARAARNTSNEGRAASFSVVENTRSALLCYAAPNPGVMTPSAGYQFVWNGAGNQMGIQMKRYRGEEKYESDVIEGNIWFDFKVVASTLGVYFTNCVAA